MAVDGGKFFCEYAWLGGDRATADVLVEISGRRIVRVTAGVAKPSDATMLRGLTIPGLANAHSHAFHRALRSRTHAGTGSFWTWREQMYALALKLDPDSYFHLARAVFGEMVCAGITCVGEFHYLDHGPGGTSYDEPNAMGDAVIAAAQAAGIRITMLDTCYLSGGFGAGLNEVQRRFSDGTAQRWAERVDALALAWAGQDIEAGESFTDVRVGAAIHSVRAVDPDSISAVAAWAAAVNAPLHAHVSEQPAENEQCMSAYGLTPMQMLADRGALSPRFSAVHTTHLIPNDVELLANHGCTVCLCPTTERDLADGIGPTKQLHDAGVVLSLGSDSHAFIDMFEEARAVEMGERVVSLTRGSHTVASLLRAATTNGHASLGWPDAGRIEVGALGDLVSIRLDSVRTAGSMVGSLADGDNAVGAAIFAASPADVHHVVVGGRTIVIDHQHVSLNVARELTESIRRVIS